MQPLDGISVLVTRPMDQNESLARAIEDQGGVAIRTPMIVIAGLADDSAARKAVASLKKTDIVIFVSKNAAEFGLELIAREGVSLKGKAVFAVGLGTAGQLGRLGIDDVQAPTSEFSSEGLLRLEGLGEQQVKGKRIVIFRGVGGREHLAKTLERRGADVVYCECYERRKPDVAIAAELKKNAVKMPDIGLATSMEALDNLVEKIEEEGVDQLFDMQMLVVGSRVAQEVESLGFTHRPMVVENPSDESILRRLVKWAEDEA
ncbi:MAG: uroporphyrinogen-III synthase [Gammaproteobacteria bacterium]|nr:uroporphyrinogen-III synthase [Gammaproteobacteria bacterium]MCP5200478.1 uroporphyrinogen-III synthase [Gammaproteobacteria bacterium]